MAPDFIGRVKRLLLSPQSEWDAIDKEPVDARGIVLNWVAPLAAVGAVASFLGWSIFGFAGYKVGVFSALITAAGGFVFSIALVFVFAFIVNALAPNFGAQRSFPQALKVAAYAPTAGWVAGILGLVPAFSLLALLGSLYSLYLLYVGLPKLMKPASEKAVSYAVVSILGAIATAFVASLVVTPPRPAGLGAYEAASGEDRAPSYGDPRPGSASGAVGGRALGGLVVTTEALKALAPREIAGLRRQEISVESIVQPFPARVMTATYGKDRRTVTLKITNSPGVNALASIAGYAGAEYDRSSADGFERLSRTAGGFALEAWDKPTKSGRYARTIGGVFLVEVAGHGVDRHALERTMEDFGDRKLSRLPTEG